MAATLLTQLYLRNEVSKSNQAKVVDRFNELLDHLSQLCTHALSNEIGMKGNDTARSIHTNITNMVQ